MRLKTALDTKFFNANRGHSRTISRGLGIIPLHGGLAIFNRYGIDVVFEERIVLKLLLDGTLEIGTSFFHIKGKVLKCLRELIGKYYYLDGNTYRRRSAKPVQISMRQPYRPGMKFDQYLLRSSGRST